jgi:subtilisin family serine protease
LVNAYMRIAPRFPRSARSLEPIVSRSRVRSACAAALPLILAVTAAAPLGIATAAEPHRAAGERPRRGSIEYRLSWGVEASRADRAYRKGATGRGVVVAMIDTGLEPASAGLFTDLSPASIDLVSDRREDDGDRGHGAQTASLLAARLDGTGTFGIAYGATLLSIRADRDGSCRKTCAFDPEVLARAIDYAVAHGARVIGMPMASKRPIPQIEPALARAVASGAVIVAAAGNDGSDQPHWPGRYASDPRYKKTMIVAGASSRRGTLTRWSNKAGVALDRYLAAPGEQVVVNCGTRFCSLTSGTSYSVAYAAGAAALLLSRAPGLSGERAAAALLGNTRDLADRGTDPLTGRGLLDVRRALQTVDRERHELQG